MLNANVAFLAIPSVDPGPGTRTSAQLASYFSIVTSIGSVVTGLLLLRQHRTKPQESSEEVSKYLQSRRGSAFGFETIAIQFSLPYSLLLWSTMAFTTAFSIETLAFSNQSWAKLSVGIVLGITAFLVIWCVWTRLRTRTFSSVSENAPRLVGVIKGLRRNSHELLRDVEDIGDGYDQDENGMPRRPPQETGN